MADAISLGRLMIRHSGDKLHVNRFTLILAYHFLPRFRAIPHRRPSAEATIRKSDQLCLVKPILDIHNHMGFVT